MESVSRILRFTYVYPASIYLLKINNRRGWLWLWKFFVMPCSIVSMVNFEHVISGRVKKCYISNKLIPILINNDSVVLQIFVEICWFWNIERIIRTEKEAKRKIILWKLETVYPSNCNHLVCKRTLSHLAKLVILTKLAIQYLLKSQVYRY